jgi:Ulp1 family protease
MDQVPLQSNSNDCGCFAIYFAKKFFSNPDSTIALIKVVGMVYSVDVG